ncbi:coiled-coil domain-containing protein 194 [Liasis olivaceus]
MDPSATRATLKVLGLCAMLLLLVAAVTISVAVMVRQSEAARQLKGCQERASNETAALTSRVAELEQERTKREKQLEKLAQREKDLQKQLSQAKEGRKRVNATLMGCLDKMILLNANLSALHDEMSTLQAEGMKMDSQNGALLVQMTRLEEKLEEAIGARDVVEAEKGHCEAREKALQESMHSYLAEIASLQHRLQVRSSSARRRCPPFWYLLWGLASFCILFPLERLIFLL